MCLYNKTLNPALGNIVNKEEVVEGALSQFSSTIITFIVIVLISYVAITIAVHKVLATVVTTKGIRNNIIQVASVIAFGVIGMSMYAGQ